jgi:hypothetical protein
VDVQTKTRRYEMRRSVLLVLTVALALLVFAPIAAAKGDDRGFDAGGTHAQGVEDRGFDDKGMHARGTDDRGFDDRGMDARGVDDRGMDDRGFDDKGVDVRGADDRGFDYRGMDNRAVDDNAASRASSASASASAMSSASASPSASPTASPTGTATATPALPETGGFLPALILGPLAMILGGGWRPSVSCAFASTPPPREGEALKLPPLLGPESESATTTVNRELNFLELR